jgi:hypothetical protein
MRRGAPWTRGTPRLPTSTQRSRSRSRSRRRATRSSTSCSATLTRPPQTRTRCSSASVLAPRLELDTAKPGPTNSSCPHLDSLVLTIRLYYAHAPPQEHAVLEQIAQLLRRQSLLPQCRDQVARALGRSTGRKHRAERGEREHGQGARHSSMREREQNKTRQEKERPSCARLSERFYNC